MGPWAPAELSRPLPKGELPLRTRWAPHVEVHWDANPFQEVTEQLQSYAQGEQRAFDVPLDLRGTSFQVDCWQALCRIPYGQCRTYAAQAEEVSGTRAHARAVGQANGANPVPVIVPCHRILAAHGLGGYSGGLDFKTKLLQLEGVHILKHLRIRFLKRCLSSRHLYGFFVFGIATFVLLGHLILCRH